MTKPVLILKKRDSGGINGRKSNRYISRISFSHIRIFVSYCNLKSRTQRGLPQKRDLIISTCVNFVLDNSFSGEHPGSIFGMRVQIQTIYDMENGYNLVSLVCGQ